MTNAARTNAIELYTSIAAEQVEYLRNTGVTFAPEDVVLSERAALLAELTRIGARIRNNGASVVLGPLSHACVACTGSCISQTHIITNNCHRDCYFCFNPNQQDFAYYCEHDFPWEEALERLAADAAQPGGKAPECLALSGGEPMLRPDAVFRFFARARELFPNVHLRLYTSGDLLTEELIIALRDSGLDEIRFSVKQEDTPRMREKVFAAMRIARRYIPTLMVEMPVTPGSEKLMHDLLRTFEELRVDAVNLLEFTYAMWNWEAFESRGYTLVNPPYAIAYDYMYAGTLAVQGSEELCLRLMLWAHEEGLTLGLHYCSLENKHRAQMRELNARYADVHPCYTFDYGDFFLKTGVVFGPDCALVRRALTAAGCTSFLQDAEVQSLSFPPKYLPQAMKAVHADGSAVQPCISYNVAVMRDGNVSFRELAVKPVEDCPPILFTDETAASDAAHAILG